VDELPTADIFATAPTGPYTTSGLAEFDGEKYPGGYGTTWLYTADYETLRDRSNQLFKENLYAKGLIRRLITNEINTGLEPEANPDDMILGIDEQLASDWAEGVEGRFAIWANNPQLCDYEGRRRYGKTQREIRTEALVGGDCLVVLHQDAVTKLPQVQTIPGWRVVTPDEIPAGKNIRHGVEIDKRGAHVAYWVLQDDDTVKRIAARGARSGRLVSWMVYGTPLRMDEVRGEPLLGVVLQSLKEIDRYRDSAQRKATVNSILAMWIKKTQNKMGSKPASGGASRRVNSTVTDNAGATRVFKSAEMIPGLVIEELQYGEEPVVHNTQGTDVNFGQFEEAIIQAIAWANEIPPNILKLAFSSNYSATQAENNEFKIYLNMIRAEHGATMGSPVYVEWLLSEVLTGRIVAPGLLEAWRDPLQYDIFGAWTANDWSGAIKPAADIVKMVNGYGGMVDRGFITNERATRETTGTKFSKNMKRIRRENELKVQAMQPLAEFERENAQAAPAAVEALRAYAPTPLEMVASEGGE
jgi:lambda family phage portal protein